MNISMIIIKEIIKEEKNILDDIIIIIRLFGYTKFNY